MSIGPKWQYGQPYETHGVVCESSKRASLSQQQDCEIIEINEFPLKTEMKMIRSINMGTKNLNVRCSKTMECKGPNLILFFQLQKFNIDLHVQESYFSIKPIDGLGMPEEELNFKTRQFKLLEWIQINRSKAWIMENYDKDTRKYDFYLVKLNQNDTTNPYI